MTDTVLIAVWPFASAILISLAELILARTKAFKTSHVSELKLPKFLRQIHWKDKTGNTALSFLIIWTAALLQFLVSMVSLYVVRKYACHLSGTVASPLDPAFFAVADVVSDICILYLLRSRRRRAVKAAFTVAVLSYALLVLEIFGFNFNCFKKDSRVFTMKGSRLVPEFRSDAENEDGPVSYLTDSVLIKDECAFIIPDVPDYAYSVTVDFVPADNEDNKKDFTRFKCRLMIEDGNSMYVYRTADKRKVSGKGSVTMFMRPHGHIKNVLLSIEGLEKNVSISSVTISDSNIYGASLIRYLILLSVASLVTLIICLRFYEIDYDPEKKLHVILLTAVFILTTGLTYLLYTRNYAKFEKYPFEEETEEMDIYQLAFDSKIKKIPYLDIEVEPGLGDLDNPYDDSERDEKGVKYKWDYAYKDGHYYCYFGEAPLYTLYYPSYLLTHRIPNYAAAVGILGTVAVVAVIMAFLAAVKMFVPKQNLLLLLMMIPAVAVSGLLYINLTSSERYYVAANSAIAGIGFAVFFGLSAVMEKKTLPRLIMFLLSGVSLAVCAGSRPTVAICAVVLLPLFFGVLFDRSRKLSLRLSEAALFLIPVIAGIVLMLLHNKARFGSLLDFGENYQLTVSDISSLKVTPEMFPSAVFYYFLMPFTAIDTFPFFEARGIILNSYEVYRNIEPSFGLLDIPFLLMGTVFLPGAFVRSNRRISKKDAASYNGFLAACVLSALFITWFDFSRGGVCIRYLTDFAWLLAIMSGVVLLRRVMRKSGRKTVYGLICTALVLTFFTVFFIMLAQDSSNLTKLYPSLLERCEDFFLFWH